MILYFNTKISSAPYVFDNTGIKVTTYTPILFPKKELDIYPNNYQILKTTLKSYSKLKFDACIFNIEVDSDKGSIDEITSFIKEEFICKNISINKKRPNSPNQWLQDLKLLKTKFDLHSPVLLCQNHDHPFVDYQSTTFLNIVDRVFLKGENNFKKCLIYSHSPDLTSICLKAKKGGAYKFTYQDRLLYETKKTSSYFDSIVILTLETAFHILNKLEFSGNYLGRFDWPGAVYKDLNLKHFFYPREFFRHFEGYYISSGIRLQEELINYENIPFDYPTNGNMSNKVDFYFNRWIDNYIVFIRDTLINDNLSRKVYKIYLNALKKSLLFFDKTYLKEDLKHQILSSEEYDHIRRALENKVYYNFNFIFKEIFPEVVLYRRGFIYRMKLFYNNELKYNSLIKGIKFFMPNSIFLKLRNLFDNV